MPEFGVMSLPSQLRPSRLTETPSRVRLFIIPGCHLPLTPALIRSRMLSPVGFAGEAPEAPDGMRKNPSSAAGQGKHTQEVKKTPPGEGRAPGQGAKR